MIEKNLPTVRSAVFLRVSCRTLVICRIGSSVRYYNWEQELIPHQKCQSIPKCSSGCVQHHLHTPLHVCFAQAPSNFPHRYPLPTTPTSASSLLPHAPQHVNTAPRAPPHVNTAPRQIMADPSTLCATQTGCQS